MRFFTRTRFRLHKKILLVSTFALCVISISIFAFLLLQNNIQQAKTAYASYFSADEVISEINNERVKAGLSPLIKNEQLTKAAQNKADDMAKKGYFAHISPVDGKKWSDFIKESQYQYTEAGENLATGYTSVQSMVQAWMNSPSHKANILTADYTETGVGINTAVINNTPVVFVTQSFGTNKGEQTQSYWIFSK